MRIWILSDLHLDIGRKPWSPPDIPDADVAVIAGDVCQGLPEAIGWAARTIGPHMPVVMTAGNHEFYNRVHDIELARGREAAAAAGVHFLEDGVVELNGVHFSGSTLWTDYALDGVGRRAVAMEAARRGLNDHRRITATLHPEWRRFRPEEALSIHRASRRFLDGALDGDANGSPHVVVTHHGPAPASVHPAFEGDPLNPAFVSDLRELIEARRPALWVHGHVHANRDHTVGTTRIVCNPHGYPSENPGFRDDLVIEVGS